MIHYVNILINFNIDSTIINYGFPNPGLHHVAQSHFQRYNSSVDPDHTQHGDI